MTNEQGFAIIGKRAEELSKSKDVQAKWLKLQKTKAKKPPKSIYTCLQSPRFAVHNSRCQAVCRVQVPAGVLKIPSPQG